MQNKNTKGSNFKYTPFFSEEVYSKLPSSLGELIYDSSNQRRQRDIKLFSTILLLSGCFPNLFGVYRGTEMTCNLFGIVGGPPASGKGTMLLAKLIGDRIDEDLEKENKKKYDAYQKELDTWMQTKSGTPPVEPDAEYFFLPANSSAAGFLVILKQNGGRGVIMDSEVDTLVLIFEQKFGDYSDIMRKAFHHEQVSSYRKTKKELISIKFPILTLLLSGTPEQLVKLLKSAENGLFSRICFYVYDEEPKFSDPFSLEHEEAVALFKQFADRTAGNYFKFLAGPKILFRFTDDQKFRFNAKFPEVLADFYHDTGSVGVSIPMRMAVVFFRIAMILSAVRDSDNDTIKPVNGTDNPTSGSGHLIICHDNDFEVASSMVDTLLNHSEAVLGSLPSHDGNTEEPLPLEELLRLLPQTFESKLAKKAMHKKGYCDRTAYRALSQLRAQKLITKVKLGVYTKSPIKS